MIEARGLTRTFGDRQAVRDLDLVARRGRVLGVLGPNGSGKSTTVRLLTGLLRPTSGSVALFGEPVTAESAPRLRSRIGVQTESDLYHRLTVAENLETWAELHGLRRSDVPRQIGEALEIVGLTDRRDSYVGSLSKGLRQKAKIARALLGDPELLFLDEPTAGLDPEAAEDLVAHLAKLRAEARTTLVLCTHQLHGLERLCDDIVVLDRGALVVAGRVEELLAQHWPTRGFTVSVNDAAAAERVVAALTVEGVEVGPVVPDEPSLHDLYFRLVRAEEEA